MKKILVIGCLFFHTVCYSQSLCYNLIEDDYHNLKSVYLVKKVEVKQSYPTFVGDTLNYKWINCYDCLNFSYELNVQGEILFAQAYGHDGLLSYQRINKFENGNCIKSMDMYSDSGCNKTRITQFDPEKRPVYYEEKSNDNTISEVITYEYKDSSFFKMVFFDVDWKYSERYPFKKPKQILVKKAIRKVYRKYKGNDELYIKEVERGQATYSSTAKFKKQSKTWQCYSKTATYSNTKHPYKYSFLRNDSYASGFYKSKGQNYIKAIRYDVYENKIVEETTMIKDKKLDSKTIINCEFIYDSYGNWIKKSEYKDGELQTTIEREITYYD
jgi:hypothetical protein